VERHVEDTDWNAVERHVWRIKNVELKAFIRRGGLTSERTSSV
jgi:hypothetical protein